MNPPSCNRLCRRLAVVGITCALVTASCGGDDTATTVATSTTVSENTSTTAPPDTTTTVPDTTTTTVPDTTTTTVPDTTTTTVPDTTTTLPGEPFEMFWREGDVLGVVGVAHDDVLNVREGPGVSYDIVATLEPTADDVAAAGRSRLLSGSIWTEVVVAGTVGWVNTHYVAYLGATSDATSDTISMIGDTPAAETMVDLGRVVAEAYASTDIDSGITITVPPTVGDLGEITYDVIGLADDAQVGVRLHVFGEPDAGGEGFTLGTVELTLLCGRGVSEDGRCI